MRTFKLSLVLATIVLPLRAQAPTDPRDPIWNAGPKQEAVGDKVMVATQLPQVTEAALQVLRDGGNAVDAFVTAVFMQQVNDYHQVSVFGALAGIYYEAKTGRYHVFNAYSDRPRADRAGVDRNGDPSKVAIGGTPRGLEALAKRFGTRTWASYLEPAIRSAEEGVIVTSFMYGNNYMVWESGEIAKSLEARELYMPDGHLVPVGARWKMPRLAATFRKIAEEGADYMYTGGWGRKFVAECMKRGYRVSGADMAEYEVRWTDPVRFTYRGQEIVAEPPPKRGGLVIGYNLNILENFDLKSLGHYTESPETLELMARAMGRVEDEIRWAIVDPLNYNVPGALWLSKDYGRIGADYVRMTRPLAGVDLRASVRPRVSALAQGPDPVYDGSNHNVIVDAEGNWISSLHTGHGGAPGILIDGVRATGSEAPASTLGPGRRIVLNSTGLMLLKDGKPWMSLGSPGSPSQPLTEVLVNLIDFGKHPKEAADAPRFWAFTSLDHVVRIESRISEKVREGMAARGIELKELGDYDWNTGSMQVVWRDSLGKLHGVTDPRRLGRAAGF